MQMLGRARDLYLLDCDSDVPEVHGQPNFPMGGLGKSCSCGHCLMIDSIRENKLCLDVDMETQKM